MSNNQLFKDAIADAKMVKETAIANAQKALTESFTPFLKERISAKIEEMENEEDEVLENEMDFQTNESSEEDIDIDAVLAELNHDDDENEEIVMEAKKDDEEKEEDEDIDLENMSEEDLKGFIEGVISDMVSSGEIEGGSGKDESPEEEAELEEYGDEHHISTEDTLNDEDEDFELDELLNELRSEKPKMKPTPTQESYNSMKRSLNEALQTIEELKTISNDINSLNARLLYSNKILKTKRNLSESQVVKILEAFDKTKSKREAKLVYETLMEGLNTKPKAPLLEGLNRGSASKATGAKSTPIISNVNPIFSRMQELAGLKPN